jgi:NTP pyrophosphatase (non-canonical NTP hydrolase)
MNNANDGIRLLDTENLRIALKKFAVDRDWEQFHSPKNLAMALSGEVGELIEIFQWCTEEKSKKVALDPETSQSVRDELADVAMYVVRLADVLGVDLNAAVATKLEQNSQKYPVDKARGSNKKYNQL